MNKYNYNTRAILMLLLTISCSLCTAQINGTGQIATRSYPLAPFTKLSINTPAPKINFKLCNNSNKKIDAYVRGPQGNRFSYGFPLRAGQKRAEEWPVGTKVFVIDPLLRIKKLAVTVTADDDRQIVELF